MGVGVAHHSFLISHFSFLIILQFLRDLRNTIALELIAALVGDQARGDRHDGLDHLEVVFLQGRAGFHNIHDDVGQP